MTEEDKELIMTFLENCYSSKVINDQLSMQEERMYSALWKLEETLTGSQRELYLELDSLLSEVLDLTKWKYFEYGENAGEIHEGAFVWKNPFKKETA
ncbi:hypothetical protein [Fusobacterium ulcerans]|uniref:Uncharacterized protein n=1 Tax=Fusobacterium ulcerans 12-1B TaxID=457404 RepID=H1PVM3_9FUSO|nr:hypothetical protein [Fusobacterium ulcerans]EHO79727.1 hypothetical protein HMPREF0402_02466 [Fusobacterium ulcerans 12-1B]